MKRPVYVSGRGAVTGFGDGLQRLIDGVYAGRTALRERRRTAAFAAPTRCVGEFPSDLFAAKDSNTDLPRQAALRACAEALQEASAGSAGEPDRATMGLVFATTKADMSGVCGPGQGLASPMHLAAQLQRDLGLGVTPTALSCACASGILGIATAARRIALGELDRVLVVAADVINAFILKGFGGMGALDPQRCRPFDADRRGVSLGDGAGAVLLSCHARESVGVRVAGYAGANDACHVTGPDYEGRGVGLAASRAIAHAGLQPDDIDVLHLHATGTRANDKSEAIGLGNVWRQAGTTPPAFGTKSQTGHTLGAAGVLESLLAIAAIERQSAPKNVGLTQTDCDPRLRLTQNVTPLPGARHALKVASGFGGVQGAAVFSA
ncbi:MAG: beta-ketoacyl synthase N-terminal-like domain-containing protein [Planctomycetota bacterium]